MSFPVSRRLSGLSVAVVTAFASFVALAQPAPMPGGDIKDCGMMGGDMKPGGMMGGDMAHMTRMMSAMHEKMLHAGDRIAALKSTLKITEAQMPAWNKFADTLLASAKSMADSMEGMHTQMMQSGASASLPEKLERHAKMAADHLANLNAIKAALDPLYASFSDEQKKLADEQKIGPMGLM
ncbi:MAG TPA: Spy/CpxP family protein refolding chaperone [Methylocella sp.]